MTDHERFATQIEDLEVQVGEILQSMVNEPTRDADPIESGRSHVDSATPMRPTTSTTPKGVQKLVVVIVPVQTVSKVTSASQNPFLPLSLDQPSQSRDNEDGAKPGKRPMWNWPNSGGGGGGDEPDDSHGGSSSHRGFIGPIMGGPRNQPSHFRLKIDAPEMFDGKTPKVSPWLVAVATGYSWPLATV